MENAEMRIVTCISFLIKSLSSVLAFNHDRIRDLQRPVLRVTAVNNDKETAKLPTADSGNLSNLLALSIGVRIMLQDNIWTERGLVKEVFLTTHAQNIHRNRKPSTDLKCKCCGREFT